MPSTTSTTSTVSTPSDPDPLTPSKSGITLTSDGQRIIPSSIRPDGSARREIRVRPGYRPPEDVEVYKNSRAEAWKNRGSGGVPGASPVEDTQPEKSASNKNAKRRAARKKAKDNQIMPPSPTKENREPAEQIAKHTTAPPKTKEEASAEEKEKQARAIRKKIRQANELRTRKDSGENLLPEQLDKIIKLNELVRQLNELGFEQ